MFLSFERSVNNNELQDYFPFRMFLCLFFALWWISDKYYVIYVHNIVLKCSYKHVLSLLCKRANFLMYREMYILNT